jgi:hypothetical protein
MTRFHRRAIGVTASISLGMAPRIRRTYSGPSRKVPSEAPLHEAHKVARKVAWPHMLSSLKRGSRLTCYARRAIAYEKQDRSPWYRSPGPCFGYEGFTAVSPPVALAKLEVLVPVALEEEAALVEAQLHPRGNLCAGLPQRCRYSKWSPRSLCSVWSLHSLY